MDSQVNTDTSRPGDAGFTLMEILISMLILAIGIMAALSMQFTALGGAAEARDNANSSEVAKRLLQMMRVESQQWRRGTAQVDIVTEAYTGGEFESSNLPLLPTVVSKNWGWTKVFVHPVDARMTGTGNTQYCAYVRGGYLDSDQTTGVVKIQLAVMYPGVNSSFTNGECPDSGDSLISDGLDPSLAPDDSNSIQMQGFRANFFGGIISQRGYLGP